MTPIADASQPRWPRGSSTSERWVPLAAAMAGGVALYAGWQLFGGASGDRPLIGDAFDVLVDLIAVLAAAGAARRCAAHPRLRAAWGLLALAFGAYLAGDVVWTIYELSGRSPYPSAADALYLLFYPLMLWGLLRFPARVRTFAQWIRLGLDLGIVTVGGSLVVIYLVLGPTLVAHTTDVWQTVFSIAYPVGDMVLVAGLASVLVRSSAAPSARALQFLATGLLFFVAADLVYGYTTLHSTFHGGDPADMLYVVSLALFAVAAAAQLPGAESRRRPRAPRGHRGIWAPNVAVAVGFTVLIADHRSLITAITAVVLATLVSLRQFLTQRDLIGMSTKAREQALHDALTGLPNRRRLMEDLAATLAPAPRTTHALAMFDLDGFKTYNDTFGHVAGDQLLTRLARRLHEFAAPKGSAYRLGGDEFCVLFDPHGEPPETFVAGAARALSETGAGFSIGASSGMVILPDEAGDVTMALHIADSRMYATKFGRRTATIIAQTRDVLLRATAEHSRDLRGHMLEVGELARDVARRLDLDPDVVELTLRTGELHDVGKVAVPESILSNAGPLTDDEWAFIRNHTLTGERVLNAAPALRPIATLVRSTHERFDGGGYPDGLRGEEIPLPARIVFACDSYSAMITRRAYSPSMSPADARAELRRCAGTQFDPIVVEALLAELGAREAARQRPPHALAPA